MWVEECHDRKTQNLIKIAILKSPWKSYPFFKSQANYSVIEFLTWRYTKNFHKSLICHSCLNYSICCSLLIDVVIQTVKVFRFQPLCVRLQHIDKIGFRSSFLSSEVAKLCSVVVHDVRINKDVKGRKHRGQPRPWQPPPSFHDRRIPPIVITFAQVFVLFCELDLTHSWKKLF